MNKKAWMKIVEAVIAILLVASVLLILISQGYIGKDLSSQFYDTEILIIREIQLNESLRNDVLDAISPVEWDDEGFPLSVKEKVNSRIPNFMDCKAKICEIDDENCSLEETLQKEIFAESGVITTTLETLGEQQLKQLKLFCWTK